LNGNVVVVGAGFGGLSTAILLARLGLRVTLVERASHPGGCLRSYSRQGVDCPVGVHYFGAAAPGEMLGDFFDLLGIRQELKLHRLGQDGVIDRYLFDDGDVFDLPDTAEKLENSLRARFGDTPAAVAFVMQVCRAAMASLHTGAGSPSPPALPVTRLAADVLAEKALPPRLVDILALQGFLLGVDLSACPASFLMMATASLLLSAWEIGCTGADLAGCLVERARAAGVSVIVGDPAVTLPVSDRRVCGVRLQSGTGIAADAVVAGIHPKTMVAMISAEALPAVYREGIARLEETRGSLGVVALVDEKRHPALGHNVYRVRGTPRQSVKGAYAQLRPSGRPGYNRLTILTESDYASWAAWHGTQSGRRGPAYRAEKLRRAQQAMAEVAEAVGPIQQPQIVDIWTPLTMRDRVGAPQGNTYGARHSIRDGLEYLVLSRPPIDGLFLVGQSALAPGLLGISMGVLHVASAIAGRPAVRDLMAPSRPAAGSSTS
jgi:all-trans-retinol 13,14-reductase